MYRAKRGGADRIEIFRPEMRADRDDRVALESDLRKALAKNQIKVLYQPIIYLPTEELAGFEALVRWEHPKRGADESRRLHPDRRAVGPHRQLGSHVLLRAAHEAARWQRELPREERPLFVSRQHLEPADLPPEPDPGDPPHPRPQHRAEGLAAAGDHREPGDGESRAGDRDPRVAARRRRRAGARRFRHGVFVARLPAAIPVRHHQDRPRAGAGERRERRRRIGHRALDRGARRTSSARTSSPKASRRPRTSASCARSTASTRKASTTASRCRIATCCSFSRWCAPPSTSCARAVFSAPRRRASSATGKLPARLPRKPTGRRRTRRRRRTDAHRRRQARCPTVRCGRVRVPPQPQATGMAPLLAQPGPPPPPQHMHHDEVAPVDFASMPPDVPRAPPPHAEQQHHAMSPDQHEFRAAAADSRHRLSRRLRRLLHTTRTPTRRRHRVRCRPATATSAADGPVQLAAAPGTLRRAAARLCAAGARGQWRAFAVHGFDDPMPPLGEHGMPLPRRRAHEPPFEPNPLLAALALEPLPAFAAPPQPMQPARRLHGAHRSIGAGATVPCQWRQETARSRPRAGRCRTSPGCRRPWPRASPSLPACRGRRVPKRMTASSVSRQPRRYPGRRVARAKPASRVQAWPASLTRCEGSMPILASARAVLGLEVGIEDQVGVGRAVEPAVGLDLALELTRRPAGIAEREDGAVGAAAGGDGLEDVDRRREADAVFDRQRRIVDEIVGAVQHEAAPGLDRAADVNRQRSDIVGDAVLAIARRRCRGARAGPGNEMCEAR